MIAADVCCRAADGHALLQVRLWLYTIQAMYIITHVCKYIWVAAERCRAAAAQAVAVSTRVSSSSQGAWGMHPDKVCSR